MTPHADPDRAALRAAILNRERLVAALQARSGPPHPDSERQECLDRLDIINPELTTLRQQLNELDAAGVVVALLIVVLLVVLIFYLMDKKIIITRPEPAKR